MTRKRIILIASIVAAAAIIAIVALLLTNCGKEEVPEPEPRTKPEATNTLTPAPEPRAQVYPLTGLPASDDAAMLSRPLSVKIENSWDARPQLGIGSADVVYETLTEGGISRFNCIFQSTIPAEVGPVRSGRNSDVTIVPQYDALFFMSGANDVVLGEIAAAGLADMSHNAASALYYRVDYRVMPHNLYLDLQSAYGVAEEKGYAITVEPSVHLEFGPSETKDASDAAYIEVPFSDAFVAQWSWDPDEKAYYRSMDGPTLDAGTDQQIAASNVVVLWADYVPVLDGTTLGVDMNSGGDASLFFDGKRIDGFWSSDGTTPPRFTDQDGNAIKLTPGNTWFQVLDIGMGITVG
jgi:hypothetical protein